MPDPLLRTLPTLGSRTRNGLLRTAAQPEPYRPTEEDITAAEAGLEAEDSILENVLMLPSRLLGGELIKGLLKDFGEGADAAQIGQTILEDNPITQLLSILTPGADFSGETSFGEVRKSGLFGDALNVDSDIGQFFIDLAGELVTDPFGTLFTPYAKVGAGGKLLSNAAKVSPDLAKAVEAAAAGQAGRALLAFKVPFTEATGFAVNAPKNIDFPVARLIQGVKDWANVNPATQRLMQAFSGRQVALGDAEKRAFVQGGFESQIETSRGLEYSLTAVLNRNIQAVPELLGDSRIAGVVSQMIETGVEGTDDAVDVYKKIRSAGDLKNATVRTGDAGRADVLGDILGLPEPLDGGGFPSVAADGEDVLGHFEKRAALADETVRPEYEAMRAANRRLATVWRDIVREEGDLAERLTDFAQNFRSEMQDIGQGDIASGVLRTMHENYFPRDIVADAAVRAKIDARVGDFTKGRKVSVSNMTTAQWNQFLQTEGVKGTGFKSFEEIVESVGHDRAHHLIMERMFPDWFTRGIGEMGEAGREAAAFFSVNPESAWMQRIKKSATKQGKAAFWRHATEEGSPLVTHRAKMRDFLTGDPELIKRTTGDVPLLVHKGGTLYRVNGREVLAFSDAQKQKAIDAGGEVIREQGEGTINIIESAGIGSLTQGFFELESKAGAALSDVAVRGVLDDRLARADVVIEDIIAEADEIAKLDVRNKDLLKRRFTSDPLKVSEPSAKRIRNLETDIAKLREMSTTRDHPLIDRLNEELSLLQDWDNPSSWGLTAREVEFLNNPRVAAQKADEVGTLKSQVSELEDVRRGLRSEQSKLSAERKRLNQQIRQARKEADPAIRGEVEADLLDDLWRVEDGLQSLKGRISRTDADVKRLRGSAGNSSRGLTAIRGNQKALMEEGHRLRGEKLKALRGKQDALRGSLVEEMGRFRRQYDELTGLVNETGRDARGRLREIASEDRPSSQDFNGLFRLYRRIETEGLSNIHELQKQAPEVAERLLSRYGDAEVVFMDAADHAQIMAAQERFSRPGAFNQALGMLDRATGLFKAWTVLPPVFVQRFTRDWVSNVAMQMQGGASLPGMSRHLGTATTLSRGMGRFVKTGDAEVLNEVGQRIAPEVFEMTGTANADELYKLMYSKGVINHALIRDGVAFEAAMDVTIQSRARGVGDEAKSAVGKMLDLIKDPSPLADNSFIKAGADLAEFGDAQPKIAAFLAHIEAGKSVDEAAYLTKKWGYDPRQVDMSAFERDVIKRFIPFYSWTKTAVKTQVQAFLERPASVAWMDKAASAAQSLSGLSDVEYELALPEYLKDVIGIPTRVDSDGNMHVFMFGDMLPLGTVAKLADAVRDSMDPDARGGIGQYVRSQMNPYIKVPMEILGNESAFTQRPIEEFNGQRVEYLGMSIPPQLRHLLMSVRMLNEIDRLNVLDLSQLGALAGVEGKQLDDLLQDTVRFDPTGQSVWERLGYGRSGFSPNPAKATQRDFDRDLERAISRKEAERSRAVTQGKRAVEDEAQGDAAAGDNIQRIRTQLADRMAELRVLEKMREQR